MDPEGPGRSIWRRTCWFVPPSCREVLSTCDIPGERGNTALPPRQPSTRRVPAYGVSTVKIHLGAADGETVLCGAGSEQWGPVGEPFGMVLCASDRRKGSVAWR